MIRFASGARYSLIISGIIKGKVQEPDITGALFRHTTQVDAKHAIVEMQNKGVVGKIQIESSYDKTKDATTVVLRIPHNGTRVEASVLVAMIETLSRVSVYEARFQLRSIEETDKDRSAGILKRAHEVYTTAFPNKTVLDPVSKLQEMVSQKSLVTVDKFTLGASFSSSQDVIIVQGRKDVVALSNAGITNVIGVGGIRYNEQHLGQLIRGKRLTIMCDGNAGGRALKEKLLRGHASSVRYTVDPQEGADVEEMSPSTIRQYLAEKKRYQES